METGLLYVYYAFFVFVTFNEADEGHSGISGHRIADQVESQFDEGVPDQMIPDNEVIPGAIPSPPPPENNSGAPAP
ncbi:hypothetical protein Tco_0929659 [Tanacetum coccineum]